MKILRKSKISWVVSDSSVVAFDKWQATIYHTFGAPTKQSIGLMGERILSSKPDEYNNWVEVISLAQSQGVSGYATRIRKEWLEES